MLRAHGVVDILVSPRVGSRRHGQLKLELAEGELDSFSANTYVISIFSAVGLRDRNARGAFSYSSLRCGRPTSSCRFFLLSTQHPSTTQQKDPVPAGQSITSDKSRDVPKNSGDSPKMSVPICSYRPLSTLRRYVGILPRKS